MHILIKKLCTLFLICNVTNIIGQVMVPESGKAYDDSEVPRVDVFLDPADLNTILTGDLESNVEFPAQFIYTTSYSIDTVDNIGFRLRGNTSRQAFKKSFKISFNSFERGRKWEGLEKLNLNGEHNDPSISRSKLAWDMYRAMGIPASRCNHVAFYINGEYRGLYANVEHIDETFINKRFSNAGGNLYKCLWPADMSYRGENPDLYKEELFGRRTYDLKTNKQQDDYTDIAHLIDVLNNYSGLEQLCELEKIVDTDVLIRCMAMDALIGNWDGAFLNKNNFYLYTNLVTGLITFIPFDLDNTFGIDWFGIDWHSTPLYNWSDISGEQRPLYETIMLIPEYRERYTSYLIAATETIFHPDTVNQYLDTKKELLRTYRINDSYAQLDYGYSLGDWETSFDNGLGGHAPFGLAEYVQLRYNNVSSQSLSSDPIPATKKLAYERNQDSLTFYINIEETPLFNGLRLQVSYDTGVNHSFDVSLEDSQAEVRVPIDTEATKATYFLSLNYGVGIDRNYPFCQDGEILLTAPKTYDLVINEFLASNENGKTDSAGDNDDWLELYNAGGVRIDLSNFFLTDDSEQPDKWQLPQQFLYPAEYYVVWADDEENQGENHADFKLKRDGEFLGLYRGPQQGYFPVDTFTFTQQVTDQSSARLPNGFGEFEITELITFGSHNERPSSVQSTEINDFSIYPNPTSDRIFLNQSSSQIIDLEIFTASGQSISQHNILNGYIDLTNLVSGLYNLRIQLTDRILWRTLIKL